MTNSNNHKCSKLQKVRVSEFAQSSLQSLSCHCSWIMEKILLKYQGNRSSKYNDKEIYESASRFRREKNVRGPLKIGEQVTIKTKTRLWKAIVVNVNPDVPPKQKDSS